jgi:hypothetical protein
VTAVVLLTLLQGAPVLGNGPTMNMQMPDPRRISGIPLPAPDLPVGSIRVRVVRNAITEVVPGNDVELIEASGAVRHVKADATGHAQFDGLRKDVTYKVAANIDGKRVESQAFEAPRSAGYKFMLVGAAAGAPVAAAPAAGGPPVLGTGPTMNMQMPDPRRISGIPLPAADFPVGQVVVRVVRDEITAVVPGAVVELTGPTGKQTATADQTGHARFTGLSPGQNYQLAVTVDGKRVESQRFQPPPAGGLKFMLVGAAAGGAPPAEGEGEDDDAQTAQGSSAPPLNPLRGVDARPDVSADPGTIAVRVLGVDGKPLVNQDVVLVSADRQQELTQRHLPTDSQGRARFDKVAADPKLAYMVATRIDGTPYNSKPFVMPAKPGLQVELHAESATHAADDLLLGSESHIAIEIADRELNVIEEFSLENRGAPYDPGPDGLLFPFPDGFTGAQTADGTPPNAQIVDKKGLVWRGMLPPGRTQLRFGFLLKLAKPDYVFRQPMPIAMDGTRVIVERTDQLEVDGPSVKQKDPRELSGRKFFLAGSEDRQTAGTPIELTLHNLPLPEQRGPYLALGASLAIVAGTVVAGRRSRGKPAAGAATRKLTERREKLLTELVALEESRRGGRTADAPYKAQRDELVQALERVYRELDAQEAAA